MLLLTFCSALCEQTLLQVDHGDADEPVRYDYYKIYRGSMTEPIREWDADIELRFATEYAHVILSYFSSLNVFFSKLFPLLFCFIKRGANTAAWKL